MDRGRGDRAAGGRGACARVEQQYDEARVQRRGPSLVARGRLAVEPAARVVGAEHVREAEEVVDVALAAGCGRLVRVRVRVRVGVGVGVRIRVGAGVGIGLG